MSGGRPTPYQMTADAVGLGRIGRPPRGPKLAITLDTYE